MKDYRKPWTDVSILSVKKKYHNDYWSKHSNIDSEIHRKVIVDIISKFNPGNVLEVGCGNGRNLRTIQRYMDNVDCFGVDLSESGIAFAKKHTKGDFRDCDARNLPFSDNFFDVVFTCHALEQMKYIIQDVSKEIFRVTKKYVVCFEGFFIMQNIFGKWHNIRSEYVQGAPFYLEDAGFKIIEFRKLERNAISKHSLNQTGVLIGKKEIKT